MHGERWVGCMDITCSSDENLLLFKSLCGALACGKGEINDGLMTTGVFALARSYGLDGYDWVAYSVLEKLRSAGWCIRASFPQKVSLLLLRLATSRLYSTLAIRSLLR